METKISTATRKKGFNRVTPPSSNFLALHHPTTSTEILSRGYQHISTHTVTVRSSTSVIKITVRDADQLLPIMLLLHYITTNSESKLLRAVANHPVSVSVEGSGSNFQFDSRTRPRCHCSWLWGCQRRNQVLASEEFVGY